MSCIKQNVLEKRLSASGMEKKTVYPMTGSVMEPGIVTMERMNRTVVSLKHMYSSST